MKRYLIIFSVFICGVFLLSSFCLFINARIDERYNALVFAGRIAHEVSLVEQDFHGDYAFAIKDFKNPLIEFFHNEREPFAAASIIKLPLLAVVFKGVSENRFSLQTIFVIERKNAAGGSGVLKSMKLPVKKTVEELCFLMIAHSDNTAANKLIDLLGFEYINKGFAEFGLKDTVLKRKMMDFSMRGKGVENYTTIADIAHVLELIYNKKLVSEYFSSQALTFLKAQKVRDRIPRYLPGGVSVAHKTGLENGVVHDAGIIFSPYGDFMICVLTKKVVSRASAKKFIAKLSALTYNLYQEAAVCGFDKSR